MQITKTIALSNLWDVVRYMHTIFPNYIYLKWDKLSFVEFEHNKMNCSNCRYVRQNERRRETHRVLDLFGDFSQRIATSKKKYKITEKYINRNKWHLGILLWGLQLTSFHGWSALEKRMKWLSTWNLNGRI